MFYVSASAMWCSVIWFFRNKDRKPGCGFLRWILLLAMAIFALFVSLDPAINQLQTLQKDCDSTRNCVPEVVDGLLTGATWMRGHSYTVVDVMCTDWFQLGITGFTRGAQIGAVEHFLVDLSSKVTCDRDGRSSTTIVLGDSLLRDRASNQTLSDIKSTAGGLLRVNGGIEELARSSRRFESTIKLALTHPEASHQAVKRSKVKDCIRTLRQRFPEALTIDWMEQHSPYSGRIKLAVYRDEASTSQVGLRLGQLFYNPIDEEYVDTFVSYFEVRFDKIAFNLPEPQRPELACNDPGPAPPLHCEQPVSNIPPMKPHWEACAVPQEPAKRCRQGLWGDYCDEQSDEYQLELVRYKKENTEMEDCRKRNKKREERYEERLRVFMTPSAPQCTDQHQIYQQKKVEHDYKMRVFDQCRENMQEEKERFREAHRRWAAKQDKWSADQLWATGQGAEHYLHYKFLTQVMEQGLIKDYDDYEAHLDSSDVKDIRSSLKATPATPPKELKATPAIDP